MTGRWLNPDLALEPTFRILGPLEVHAEKPDQPKIPPGRHQIVLSALLMEANRLVRIDQLIDAIWYDDPPATARAQVQICVSGLRTFLAKLDAGATIATRPPGYLLNMRDEQLDAHLFVSLVTEAEALMRSGKPEDASHAIRRAISLWRGPALNDTTSRILQAKAAQLDEKRLSAIETYAELELDLGRHHQLIEQIDGLVGEYPLRERLRGQLMLALYRSGRRADALRIYRDGRDVLVEQLGLEPNTELRALEHAILVGDERLSPTVPPVRPPADPVEAPRQMPADIADFTGRADLISEIEECLITEGRRSVVVIIGKPGVGKSSLAVHIGHRLGADHYPGGQLYADLGGTRAELTSSADVLGRFLRDLGIPGPAIPDTINECGEMYQRIMADRRMLVLLDDAETAAQVAPLLPNSPNCDVIITSRARLADLPGSTVVDVDVMDAEQSFRLLGEIVGMARVSAERASADALIRLVGGLPLALRVVAARLAARPHWSLAWMRDRLADERRRLDELAHGDLMVRASLAISYDGLDPDASRLLRSLSTSDAVSLPVWSGAALLDVDLFRAADLLELLVDVQMLEIAALDLNGSPRYKFHDIIRLFARERAEQTDSPDERREQLRRVAGGWLAMAREAHRRVYGGDFTLVTGGEPGWMPPDLYTEQVLADPLKWFEAERANLCAAVAQCAAEHLDELSWNLAVTLVALFESRCYYDDWERTHTQALTAAREAGNARGVAALLCSMASLHLSRSRLDAAEAAAGPALVGFVELGDMRGRALAHRNLGLLHQARGDPNLAMVHHTSALADFAATDDPIGQAHVLSQIAQIEIDKGAIDMAAGHLTAALAHCDGVGNRRVEAQVRYSLSGLMLRQERHQEACDLLSNLVDVVRAGRDIVGESRILHRLGVANALLNRREQAARLLREALATREQILDYKGVELIRADIDRFDIDASEHAPTI